MERVIVIGPCGAGKSTASVELGEALGLPVYHLDRLHWRAGWVESPREELLDALAPILAGERWLIDGNYGGTMGDRIERADTVVYLDYPTWLCLWRVLKRYWRFRGRSRPDMAEDCPEHLNPAFLLYVLTFRRASQAHRSAPRGARAQGASFRSPAPAPALDGGPQFAALTRNEAS